LCYIENAGSHNGNAQRGNGDFFPGKVSHRYLGICDKSSKKTRTEWRSPGKKDDLEYQTLAAI
jgi:hypothetical protein